EMRSQGNEPVHSSDARQVINRGPLPRTAPSPHPDDTRLPPFMLEQFAHYTNSLPFERKNCAIFDRNIARVWRCFAWIACFRIRKYARTETCRSQVADLRGPQGQPTRAHHM